MSPIPLYGQVSSFAGFFSAFVAHTVLRRAQFGGGLMLLAFAFLLLSGGQRLENLVFYWRGEIEKGIHFDQIVLLKRNANLREGPSTNTRIKASLKVSQRPSFQVVRQVNGGLVRSERGSIAILQCSPDDGVKQFWMVGLENLANEIGGAPTVGLVAGLYL